MITRGGRISRRGGSGRLPLFLFVAGTILDKIVDHVRIGKGRRVAKIVDLVLGDLAQDAPHDLAGTRFREAGGELDDVRRGDRADVVTHPALQLLAQVVVALRAALQGDIGVDALALLLVRIADDCRLGDLRVGAERTFDFGRPHAVTGDVDDVVDAAGDPVVTVLVAPAAVAGEVLVLVCREIGLDEALVVAENRAHLAWPGPRDDERAFGLAVQHLAAFGVDDLRLDAEERQGCGAGLQVGCAGQRRDHVAARFGLPPGVDDRAAALADHLVIPDPGFRIDRLADRAEHTQTVTARLLDMLVPGALQRADGGRRRIEDVDLVLVDDLPAARGGGIGRQTLEHQGLGAIRERPVDDVAVSGDPADVCRAPIDVAVVVVEDVFVRHRRVDEIAACRMQDALGGAGRAGGVEDEKRVLGAHGLGLAVGRCLLHLLLVPDVATFFHVDGPAGALDDDRRLDDRRLVHRLVGVLLERDLLRAADAFVAGDQHLRFTTLDALGERVRREATEHDRVDRADPRAGEHRVGGFGDHRQVDRDRVAFLDALVLEDVGEAADVLVKLLVGDIFGITRLVALEDDRGLVAALLEMAVDAVHRDVGDAVLVPFDRDLVGIIRAVHHFGKRLDPVDPLAVLAPEGVRVVKRGLVHLLIFGLVDQRTLLGFARNRIYFDLVLVVL